MQGSLVVFVRGVFEKSLEQAEKPLIEKDLGLFRLL